MKYKFILLMVLGILFVAASPASACVCTVTSPACCVGNPDPIPGGPLPPMAMTALETEFTYTQPADIAQLPFMRSVSTAVTRRAVSLPKQPFTDQRATSIRIWASFKPSCNKTTS